MDNQLFLIAEFEKARVFGPENGIYDFLPVALLLEKHILEFIGMGPDYLSADGGMPQLLNMPAGRQAVGCAFHSRGDAPVFRRPNSARSRKNAPEMFPERFADRKWCAHGDSNPGPSD